MNSKCGLVAVSRGPSSTISVTSWTRRSALGSAGAAARRASAAGAPAIVRAGAAARPRLSSVRRVITLVPTSGRGQSCGGSGRGFVALGALVGALALAEHANEQPGERGAHHDRLLDRH